VDQVPLGALGPVRPVGHRGDRGGGRLAAGDANRGSYLAASPAGKAAFDPVFTVLQGIELAQLFVGALGVIAVTGEYNSGLIRGTFVATPQRAQVLAMKALVFAVVVWACCTAMSFAAFFLGQMPRLDGVAATRALLRGAAPVPTKILILTTFHLDAYVTEALRAGASGFLLKEATADQLTEAVRVIAAGEAILAPSVTRRLLERMAEDSAATGDGGRQIRDLLSAREADVLLLVARGLSNAEIGAKLHLAETTVKSHVQSMLGKLGVRDRLQAAVAAYDAGLVRPQGS
jgi:DNA-binding NarL/FixJ family response regulator